MGITLHNLLLKPKVTADQWKVSSLISFVHALTPLTPLTPLPLSPSHPSFSSLSLMHHIRVPVSPSHINTLVRPRISKNKVILHTLPLFIYKYIFLSSSLITKPLFLQVPAFNHLPPPLLWIGLALPYLWGLVSAEGIFVHLFFQPQRLTLSPSLLPLHPFNHFLFIYIYIYIYILYVSPLLSSHISYLISHISYLISPLYSTRLHVFSYLKCISRCWQCFDGCRQTYAISSSPLSPLPSSLFPLPSSLFPAPSFPLLSAWLYRTYL